ncbi:MAG: deoxyguanosinetriphosphate triphosphohydrolase [Planctomycetes bacterium]|nr:deoxyguanosinetriphosphate triphosphohydrolase [Planctomycetota bacterium]
MPHFLTMHWPNNRFNSNDAREELLLAPYAMHSANSAGRHYTEPAHAYRSPYQRDRDRILHSGAFRRLSHKTQVFTGEMGDYHRTRLTHTLEVSSIARTIARALRLNEDLVEALALAHDLGHPPFGHSGEHALDECLAGAGGFNHNAQALRICVLLETRYPDFPGLNLTREVLEGQLQRAQKKPGTGSKELGVERTVPISDSSLPAGYPLGGSPLLEVQVVDAADSIAYDAHDADDALEIGFLTLNDLLEIPLWHEACERIGRRFGNLDDRHRRRAIVHEVIDWQVSDVLGVVQAELASRQISSVADVRNAPIVVRPSVELAKKKAGLERFLFEAVYHHSAVLAKRKNAQRSLCEMFEVLTKDSHQLPAKFHRIAETDGLPRAVGDYLAGMTDRFAFEQYGRLTNG